MRNATRRTRRTRRTDRRSGNAILEMALVLPLLMFLAMGMVEFGQFFYIKNAFEQAARDAARAALMPNAQAADPAAAATRTLATAGITFQPSWLSMADYTSFAGTSGAGASVSDCSQIPIGHAISLSIGTTYGSLPGAVRPLYTISGGYGIPSGRPIAGSCFFLKE